MHRGVARGRPPHSHTSDDGQQGSQVPQTLPSGPSRHAGARATDRPSSRSGPPPPAAAQARGGGRGPGCAALPGSPARLVWPRCLSVQPPQDGLWATHGSTAVWVHCFVFFFNPHEYSGKRRKKKALLKKTPFRQPHTPADALRRPPRDRQASRAPQLTSGPPQGHLQTSQSAVLSQNF